MRVLTAIGEIGIEVDSREIILRPSFANIQTLGSPKEIVELLADVFAAPPPPPTADWQIDFYKKASAAWWRRVHWASYCVIAACANQDITDLLGSSSSVGRFTPGRIPFASWQPLAGSLLAYGVVGKVSMQAVDKADPENRTTEFKCAEMVSQAIVHLGMSEDAAWNMTCTSFLHAMRAKFGKAEKALPETKAIDGMMDELDRINAIRDKGKKRGS